MMNIKKITASLLIAASVFAFTSCKSDGNIPAGMISATDEKASFDLFVPDEWTVDYSTAAAGAYFSSADPSSVSVMAWEVDSEVTKAEDWWKMNEGEIAKVFSNFTLVSEDNATMASLHSKKYVYTADLGEFSYKIMQCAALKGGSVYLFTYTSTPENYDSHLDDVDDMLEYMRID